MPELKGPRKQTSEERIALENQQAADRKESERKKRSQMNVGGDPAPLTFGDKKKRETEDDIKDRRKSIQNILSQGGVSESAESVLSKVQHLNDLNEVGIAVKAMLETVESFLKLIFNTEYLIVQRNAFNSAPK